MIEASRRFSRGNRRAAKRRCASHTGDGASDNAAGSAKPGNKASSPTPTPARVCHAENRPAYNARLLKQAGGPLERDGS